jgi:hypothetical protein
MADATLCGAPDLLSGLTAVAGIDGRVALGTIDTSGECCTPRLCDISEKQIACAYVDLLPNGPLWDRNKDRVRSAIAEDDLASLDCPSVPLYAAYVGRLMYSMIQSVMIPTLRELDPMTASATVQDWLAQFDYTDCISQCSKSTLNTVPLHPQIPYDPELLAAPCVPVLPDDLQAWTDRAKLTALTRYDLGSIGNLASINWILEPLNAVLAPVIEDSITIDDVEYPCSGVSCCNSCFTLTPLSDEVTLSTVTACSTETSQIAAFIETDECSPGTVVKYYPALDVALCLVYSLVSRPCEMHIKLMPL